MAKPRITAKYWEAILYTENMVEHWKEIIDDVIQVPFAYCVHDKDPHIVKDSGEVIKKIHVHLFIAYNNVTTLNQILKLCNKLSLPGARCCSTAEEVVSPVHAYDYLIHATKKAREQGKFLYPENERITGNNFDIHFIANEDEHEKCIKVQQLTELIIQNKICNYVDFVNAVLNTYDDSYFHLQEVKSSYFEKLTKGNYNKYLANDVKEFQENKIANKVKQNLKENS